jgi:phasin family protein
MAASKSARQAEKTTSELLGARPELAFATVELQRQWIEIIRASTNAALDFAHEALGVKSPSAFLELSSEHARKQAEVLAEQARQFTGMTQKLATDISAPIRGSSAFNKAA